MSKYGFSLLNQNLNSNNNNGFITNQTINQWDSIRAVRVLSIILDETHPRFKELGEWNSLGIIEYEDVINPLPSNSNPVARPLLGNNKNYPLVNELVYILSLPNTDIGTITSNSYDYYINVISLWNHPHHNGFPSNPNVLPPSQQKDYNQTELGNIRRITDQSTDIFLGKTFKERSNIHPLLPFEGDIINEGRWGNSIRIGSTVNNKINNWSSTGSNGDPIIIIRNGQGIQSNEGWIPIVENINNNESSIYITSTQKIPLKASSINYNSYNNPPENPDQFSGKQIMISSGRLVFNSSDNHILFSSNKSINLNSLESINFDSPSTIIQSNKSILLGSKLATESILKGDSFIKQIQILLNQLILLTTALQSVPQTSAAAQLVLSELPKISAALEETKSKISKTI